MNLSESVSYFVLLLIGTFVTAVFGVWWFLPSHIPSNFLGYWHIFDYLLFSLLTFVVWYQILNELLLWDVALEMKKAIPFRPQKNLKVAFLTAFVPGKEPISVLEKTLIAIKDVNYHHDTWVLDEGNDSEVKKLCENLRVYYFSRKGIRKYNHLVGPFRTRSKAGNYNAWFDCFGKFYEIVAQVDMDFIPKKNFLTSTLGFFRNPEVAFVGTPQIYGNINDSWIARGAAEQAYSFYGPMQRGLFGKDMNMFIGANHIVRVKALIDVEGYAGHIVEDHLTGMRYYAKKWKSVYVPKILAVGEGPSTWQAYFNQQMRWSYGLMNILFHQSPKLLWEMSFKHALNYFILQLYYFYGLAQAVGVVLLTLYFFFGINSTSMKLLTLLSFYLPLIAIQQVISTWLQRFNVEPKSESGALLRGRLLSISAWPVYFIAFICVLFNKRLNYKVTPKGKNKTLDTDLRLFTPHFIIGTISLLGILAAFITRHQAPQLLFFAIINCLFMYGFMVAVLVEKVNNSSSERKLLIPKLSFN